MEHFDDAVSDPALRLAELDAFLRTAKADDRGPGAVPRPADERGNTGQRGVIVYNRHEWIATLAASLRSNQVLIDKLLLQSLATLPRRTRPTVSGRLLRATDVGLSRRLTIDAQEPLSNSAAVAHSSRGCCSATRPRSRRLPARRWTGPLCACARSG